MGRASFFKAPFAVAVGLVLAFSLIGAGELFFRANKKWNWLQRARVKAEYGSVLPPEWQDKIAHLDYLKNLTQGPDFSWPAGTVRKIRPRLGHQTNFVIPPGRYHTQAANHDESKIYYSNDFEIDEYSRRVVPSSATKPSDRSLILLGCSYVFGSGVEDNETLAYFLQNRFPDRHVYNMGQPGSSPSRILSQLQDEQDVRNKGIQESESLAIYVYIDDHLNRVTGTSDWVSSDQTQAEGPNYELEGDRLVRRGTFDDRGVEQMALKLLGNLALADFFNLQWPKINASQFQRFAAVIDAMAEEVEKKYSAPLIVVVYPLFGSEVAKWRPYLHNQKIRFLDYGNMPIRQILKSNDFIPGDGHPSPLANRFLADILADDLLK